MKKEKVKRRGIPHPGTKDELGKRYGRLLVIERAGVRNGLATWLCQCDCGKQVEEVGALLRSGKVKSCGCLNYATREERLPMAGEAALAPPTMVRLPKDITYRIKTIPDKTTWLRETIIKALENDFPEGETDGN